MRDFDPDSKRSNSPVKIALAALLTVIFIVVLVFQFGGTSGAEDADQRGGNEASDGPGRNRGPRRPGGPRAANAAANAVAKVAAKSSTDSAPARPWPVVDPSRVLKHDPFSLSSIFAKPDENAKDEELPAEPPPQPVVSQAELERRQAAQREVIEQLRQQGVKAIVRGDRRDGAALLGSQVVRVGDEVGGCRVIAIRRDGVVLQPPAIKPPGAEGSTK